jgi:hypothetical protein
MDRAGAHVAEWRPVAINTPWALDPTPDGSREQAARSERDWHAGTSSRSSGARPVWSSAQAVDMLAAGGPGLLADFFSAATNLRAMIE